MYRSILSLGALALLASCSQAPVSQPKSTQSLKVQADSSVIQATQLQAQDIPNHYKDIQFPEFNYTPPKPLDYRVELDSNTIAYLYPSQQLPIVKLDLYFEEANLSDDESKLAPYSLLGSNYKRGGTEKYTPEALEDTLEFESIQISVNLSERSSSININTLKEQLPQALDLMQEIVLKPRFDAARLEVFKQQINQAIKHKYDKPANISKDLFSQVMKGPHPSNWSLTVDEVNQLKPEQLKQLSHTNFQGKKLYIGVSGDFEKEAMIQTLKDMLSKWKTRNLEAKHIAPPQLNSQAMIHVYDFPSTQTQIRMAQPFLQRPHPDYYPTSIANNILGSGGFTSRLVASIRTEHGLAYSVGSFAQSNYEHPGMTGVVLQTKVESSTQALELIKKEILRLTEEGPTDLELQNAKDALTASLPSLFNTPESTVDAFIYSERRGRSFTHYEDYPKALAQVTKEQVQAALKKYFDPDKMVITLVGPLDKLKDGQFQTGPSLDSLGQIQIWTQEDLEKRK